MINHYQTAYRDEIRSDTDKNREGVALVPIKGDFRQSRTDQASDPNAGIEGTDNRTSLSNAKIKEYAAPNPMKRHLRATSVAELPLVGCR